MDRVSEKLPNRYFMDPRISVLKVFIATPGDLTPERQALRKIVEKINKIYSRETQFRIELLGWEDTLPGQGRPQEIINQDLDKADLFIGCLWQRIGSDSGNAGQTGFEEEFYRSLSRRQETGKPEMWLFFKHVDEFRKSDPGAQLSRVLEFRKQEEEAKRILFRAFSTLEEWNEQLADSLHSQMLRVMHAFSESKGEVERPVEMDRSIEQSKQTEGDINEPDSNGNSDEGNSKIVKFLSDITEDLTSVGHSMLLGEVEGGEKIKSQRLFLYATANYDSSVLITDIGAHEANKLFLNRRVLKISGYEKLYLFKCSIKDAGDVIPGWYWLSMSKWGASALFKVFCGWDSDSVFRSRIVEEATKIGFRLDRGSSKKDRPIEKCLVDSDTLVRVMTLDHIAKLDLIRYFHVVEKWVYDRDYVVSEKAKKVLQLLRLKSSTDEEAKEIFNRERQFDEDLTAALKGNISKVETDTLTSALNNPSVAVVELIATELFRRAEYAVLAAMGSHGSTVVDSLIYRAKSTIGQPVEVREVLNRLFQMNWSFFGRDNEDAKRAMIDVLSVEPVGRLWERVEYFDDISQYSLMAILRNGSKADVGRVRASVVDEFKMLALSAGSRPADDRVRSLLKSESTIDAISVKLTTVGLQALASNPENKDREVFLKIVGDGPIGERVAISCIGLKAVGRAEDAEVVSSIWKSDKGPIGALAAWVYLGLSECSESSVIRLLEDPEKDKVWFVVDVLLSAGKANMWGHLESLLRDISEDVRRIACYFAIRTQSVRSLRKILEKYQDVPDAYYYNVVNIMDKIAYSPKDISRCYLNVEETWFIAQRPNWERYLGVFSDA